MEQLLAQLALAGGLAWASGIRLYATLFLFGMLGRFGYVVLPQDLQVLQHDWVLVVSGVMLVGEFIADKVPWFDSMWDAVHTFIRIPAGILLAWGVFADYGAGAQLAAAIVGGAIVSGTHLTKAGARATINHSPEPVSNWFTSFAEDGLVLGGLWLAVAHPVLFLVFIVLFLALVAWLLPKLFRGLRWMWSRLRGGSGRADAPVP